MFGPSTDKDKIIDMLVEAWNECNTLKGERVRFERHKGGWNYLVDIEKIVDGLPFIVVHLCDSVRSAKEIIEMYVPQGSRFLGPYGMQNFGNEGKVGLERRLEYFASAAKN